MTCYAVADTGFSVASLEEAIQFWTEAMGFDLTRRGEVGKELQRSATEVYDPRCRVALERALKVYPAELLEYPIGRTLGETTGSVAAIGAVPIAFTVTDISTAISRF